MYILVVATGLWKYCEGKRPHDFWQNIGAFDGLFDPVGMVFEFFKPFEYFNQKVCDNLKVRFVKSLLAFIPYFIAEKGCELLACIHNH
jgi:hypothetical protein